MDDIMLKIDNVSKMYKLGQIGGTTLRDELQRLSAKMCGGEDPTRKIGTKDYNRGETFFALNGVSLEVKKGERVGIIGHNGAGKSTLLKLISRVTAPTGGKISMNGRVASMLEVGTGFHPELTGRENIYMNGAILGMTKKEIDAKMEDIIDFSECRQFIDTPVKRYSSGMYVKLAFSVAAHLDSEIMIMDEVLAVGDMNFQQKCLQKMKNVAVNDGRTILYVSHNMSTIRQLCNRCIVLNHGKVIFDGDVEKAISYYISNHDEQRLNYYDLAKVRHDASIQGECLMTDLFVEQNEILCGEKLEFKLHISSDKEYDYALLRIILLDASGGPIGMAYTESFHLDIGNNIIAFRLDTTIIVEGNFSTNIVLIDYNNEIQTKHDVVYDVLHFSVTQDSFLYNYQWSHQGWGDILFKCQAENISIQ